MTPGTTTSRALPVVGFSAKLVGELDPMEGARLVLIGSGWAAIGIVTSPVDAPPRPGPGDRWLRRPPTDACRVNPRAVSCLQRFLAGDVAGAYARYVGEHGARPFVRRD